MKYIFYNWLFVVMMIQSTSAHDFWIQPSSFSPNRGEKVGIHLRVGQHFRGEIVPRMSNWMDHFEYIHQPSSEVFPVEGKEWNDPAGEIAIQKNGLYVVSFQSLHQSVVIDPATFALYLREEGLESILKLRETRGESQTKGKEIFLRSCKAIISCGEKETSGFDHIFGLKLELIPLKNPLMLSAGEELPLQLLFMGKPIEGVLVAALEYDIPEERITARTDSHGRVQLKLPKQGRWLIKAVHLTEVEDENVHADWQSFWASLVFENRN